MEPFATLDDLNARRASDLTGRAASVAEARLADASAKVASELDASGIPWARWVEEGREPFVANLRAITCAMVERATEQPLPLGLKSQQATAGPYSFTSTSANPGGDLYLLASERRTLGIVGARVGFLRPLRDGGGR